MAVQPASESTRRTTVKLTGLREKYSTHCPKRPETIASHITEHCMEFFIRGNCPAITLSDPDTDTEDISLNRIFESGMVEKSENRTLTVKGERIDVTHVKLYSLREKEHSSHYCANDRVVQSRKLAGKIPNITEKLTDKSGKPFIYAAYVGGEVLDSSVSAERTSFAIDESPSATHPDELSWSDIVEAVDEESQRYLSPYTEPVRDRKKRRIEDFVATQAPMYRPILPYIQNYIDSIAPDIDDDALDLELYKAYHALDIKTKAEGTALLSSGADDEDFTDYSERMEAYFETVTDLKSADLARYVCQRKAVLDFLHKKLGQKDDGKHHL